jgi:hypothetical protein
MVMHNASSLKNYALIYFIERDDIGVQVCEYGADSCMKIWSGLLKIENIRIATFRVDKGEIKIERFDIKLHFD